MFVIKPNTKLVTIQPYDFQAEFVTGYTDIENIKSFSHTAVISELGIDATQDQLRSGENKFPNGIRVLNDK